MEERRRCTTVRQLELLIEFMEGHRDLALGRVRSKEARAFAARLWRECGEIVNVEGPARTAKEWAKVWNDMKCRVRAKLVSINANQRATGGGPSNAPTLTPLEERVANILGRDVGPLADVRQDQFSRGGDGMVEEVVEEFDGQIASLPILLNINEDNVQTVDNVQVLPSSPVHIEQLPSSPVPSLAGQAPTPQTSPRRLSGLRSVRQQQRRRVEPASRQHRQSTIQSSRSALEESRQMILHIEEMRAETALGIAQAATTIADAMKLIAESIDRCSQKDSQQRQQQP